MIFKGTALQVDRTPGGFAQLDFNLPSSSVNKLDRATLEELRQAIGEVARSGVAGLVLTSSKPAFIVGADIGEFPRLFQDNGEQLQLWIEQANALFNAIEDLPFPTVTALDGIALGGGCELAVATDFRIATERAIVGFPEVKLGIVPGFGGTGRLPRLIGADNANEWIATGKHVRADQAFRVGAIDAIVARERLLAGAGKLIDQANEGKLDYRGIRRRKVSPLQLSPVELQVAFDTARAKVEAEAGPHYPAPRAAVELMHEAAAMERGAALQLERRVFLQLAAGEVCRNLVQMFLSEQAHGQKRSEKHDK